MPEVLQEIAPKDLYASKMAIAEVKLLCRFKKNGIIVMSQDHITSSVFEKKNVFIIVYVFARYHFSPLLTLLEFNAI